MTESNIQKQNSLRMKSRCRWIDGLYLATGTLVFVGTMQAQETTIPPSKPGQVVLPKSYDGESDFEEACRLKLNLDSIEKLKEIIGLTESALKKGLDESDSAAAKKMIAATYVQKTEEALSRLGGQNRPSAARVNKLLDEVVEDLGQAIEYDPLQVDAYLLKTEIHARRNERDDAFETADAGIEKILPQSKRADAPTKSKLSRLLMIRASLRTQTDETISDLKNSILLNPNNTDSIAVLQVKYIQEKKIDDAVEFFQSVIQLSPENELLICLTAELMASKPEGINEALDLLNAKIKLMPKSTDLLKSRAKVYSVNKEPDLAKEDLDNALKLSETDVDGLLLRARFLLQTDDLEGARRDVDAAYVLDNNRVAIVLLRSAIAAEQKRYGDAINDLQMIIKAQPKDKDPGLLMQLAMLYTQDNRPKQAIKVFDQVIKANEDYWQAYRFRGDTRLSIGNHAEAIADFEKSLEMAPEDEVDRSGTLNNLSWVLSTSPDDKVRNGKRALELALESCKLTEYAKPHILSTLAAAYAELGDFEKAVEWSTKGVEIARKTKEPQLEQLESELKNYLEKKPWREKTETKENKAPVAPGSSGVDT